MGTLIHVVDILFMPSFHYELCIYYAEFLLIWNMLTTCCLIAL